MPLSITSLGNAGVFLHNAAGRVYIDAFFQEAPGVGGKPFLKGADAEPADLILITHPHHDHMNKKETAAAANKSGALVAGPARAVAALQSSIAAERLTALEPRESARPPDSVTARFGDIAVTAFRTYHGSDHNSYLIEMDGTRIYHDADNEYTQPLDLAQLGRIDLLLLCPWAGSGAGEFVNKLQPRHWLLIHMTESEIAQHRAGAFLPHLIAPVPDGVGALAPGESMEI